MIRARNSNQEANITDAGSPRKRRALTPAPRRQSVTFKYSAGRIQDSTLAFDSGMQGMLVRIESGTAKEANGMPEK